LSHSIKLYNTNLVRYAFQSIFIFYLGILTLSKGGCGRLEWSCLDWNRPSIDFYLSLDAEPMTGWTVYRLSAETLRRMAEDGAEQDSAAFADMI